MKKEQILKYIYLLAVCIFTLEVILFDSCYRDIAGLHGVFVLMRLSSYGMILVKLAWDLFSRKYSIRELLIYAAVGILLVLVAYFSGKKDYLIYWAFIVAGHDVDYRVIIKAALGVHLLALVLTIGGSLIGVIPNNINIRSDGTVREGLGFLFGGLIAHFVFYTVLLWIYCRKEVGTWIEFLLMLLLQCWVFSKTDTKAPFAFGIAALLGAAVLKLAQRQGLNKQIEKAAGYASWLIIPVSVCGILLLTYFYDPSVSFFHKLNSLLTDRLRYGHDAWMQYGIPLFGQRISWSVEKSSYNYVDSSYIHILLNYGVLMLGSVCVGFHCLCRKAAKNKSVFLLLCLAFVALHSMFDDQLLWLGSNGFLLCCSCFLSPSAKES